MSDQNEDLPSNTSYNQANMDSKHIMTPGDAEEEVDDRSEFGPDRSQKQPFFPSINRQGTVRKAPADDSSNDKPGSVDDKEDMNYFDDEAENFGDREPSRQEIEAFTRQD